MHTILSKLIITVALLGALVSTTTAQEKEASKYDPAVSAATIAPFIDAQTFLVARLDVTRLDPMKLVDKAIEIVPDLEEKRQEMSMGLGAIHAMVTQAGIREVYAVLTSPDTFFTSEAFPFLIVPSKGVKEESLPMLAKALKLGTTERLGDVMFVGSPKTLKRLKTLTRDERPELVEAFKAAGDTTAQVLLLPPKHAARVIEEMMPELPEPIGGGPSTIVTHGLRWAALSVDAPPNLSARLVVQSDDAQSAAALRELCIKGLGLFGQIADVRKVVGDFGPIAKFLTPSVADDHLVLALSEENGDVKWLVDATRVPFKMASKQVRLAASMNTMKQFGLAMQYYHSAIKAFPAAAICNKQGKPLLSWRVRILPFIEEHDLWEQFHMDEPWDSEHNRKLIAKMPRIFRGPASNPSKPGRTPYVVPRGKGTAFPERWPMPLNKFTDGASQTIMAMEVDDKHAVIWTKPDDFPIDIEKPSEGLAGPYDGGIVVLFADGSIHFLELPIKDERLRALLTPAGGDKPDRE